MKLAVKHLAAVAALAFSAGASATDYPFTMPLAAATPFSLMVNAFGPSFSDNFTFTAPATAINVSGSVVSIDIAPFFNVNNIQISLFDANNTLISSGVISESSKVEDISVIAGNIYYFQVTGMVPSPAMSGFYVFSAIAAPIPEPETYALMLGGLGLVGFMAARRRRQD